jgi:hypothetical protein
MVTVNDVAGGWHTGVPPVLNEANDVTPHIDLPIDLAINRSDA